MHDAGLAFNDAVTKVTAGVNSGNQTSIVNDLNTAHVDLQNAVTAKGFTGQTLQHAENVMNLLNKEAALVSSIDTTSPTQVSGVNGQIANVQSHILNIVNHDATLAAQAAGADGTTGFAPLPSSAIDPHSTALTVHHFEHVWG